MIESIQDAWSYQVDQDDVNLARSAGIEISRTMKDVPDFAGYSKTGGYHQNWQNEWLGKLAEVAWTRFNGHSPFDTSVMTLWESKNSNQKHKPDVFGRDELRRVECFGTPVKMKRKDVDAGALVISALVEHHCDPDTHVVIPNGRVYFLEWQNAVEDWPKSHALESGLRYCTPLKRRTMDTFPMMGVLV